MVEIVVGSTLGVLAALLLLRVGRWTKRIPSQIANNYRSWRRNKGRF